MLYGSDGKEIERDAVQINAPVGDDVVGRIKELFLGGLLIFKQQGRVDPFFVRDIIGGVNHQWTGIAPIELYNAYYEDPSCEDPFVAAGYAAGRIFKATLIEHSDRYQLVGYITDDYGKRRAQYRLLS